MELIINQLADLEKAAKILFNYANIRKKWCFYGDLGAGKTTFIKAIGHYLNIEESITSPTYSLVNEYSYKDTRDTTTKYLYHLDLYRLKHIEEALDIGIEEYLYDDNYCFIEWAEIIEPILPLDVVKVNMELLEDGRRKIVWT